MAEVKWIKLSTSMFEDEKIRLIEALPEADTILIIWVKLLAQAGKTNASGYIYLNENIPFTDEMLATIFNRPIGTVRLALKTFEQFGMIEINDNNFISIANWEKHQNLDGLEKIREQNRLRKQKERKQKKLNSPKKDSHVTVTPSHATEVEEDIDKEVDKDIDKDKEEEVKAAAAYKKSLLEKYVSLRGYGFDHSPKDEQAAEELLASEIPLENVIYWLEEKFQSYTPKHSRDRINSLSYCVGYILDKYHQQNSGEEGEDGKKVFQHRRGYGRSSSKTIEEIEREAEAARRAWGGS